MLTEEERDKLVSELAARPGHEKVRALLHRLLVDGLGADSRDIDFEKPAPEVHGRIDALLGRTVFELKSDLRRERKDAEEGLARYLSEREGRSGEKFVGIATDGADFTAYFLKNGAVVEVGAYRTDPATSRDLLPWLQGAVAIGEGLPPDPATVKREFGRESLAAKRALDDLGEFWDRIGKTPEGRLKRELWNRLLGIAYGAEVGDDGLFLQHTYLAVVAKAVAWAAMIEAPPENAAALLYGTGFSDLGITGQSEPDFFDWMLASEDGGELVMRIAGQVNRFRMRDIRVDILKAIYESLIDPETRHDLGEYYTPDWLAARVVAATVNNPLEQRVMDPACGSGTFLFHAVRAVLDAAGGAGLSPSKAVRRAVELVAGIDIHPVAVIFARVTYLLACLPVLRKEHPGSIALPVYLGDALQWNLARTGEKGKQLDLLASDDVLEIFVPAFTLPEPRPRRLGEARLRFPAGVASDAGAFDHVLNIMITFGAGSKPAASFAAWMDREITLPIEDREVLRETYEVMRRLQNEGRNHIWGYVARNLARPVWLSSEGQKADVVIGNPPWLAYRHMKGSLQDRYKKEAVAARVWWSGRGTSANDLSAYFYTRAASLYMRRMGRIALVMPYAAMTRQAYREFRKGRVARYGHVEFRLRFTNAWAFGPDVQPIFPVPSCVLFAEVHGEPLAAALPKEVRKFAGVLPMRDADRVEAERTLKETAAFWPTEASELAGSPYRRMFRNGATLWPRRLVLVEPVPVSGRLPPNPEFPLVRGRTGNQDKLPWKYVSPPQGTIEKEFLRPVLLGECIAPFRVLSPQRAVIPWDAEWPELLYAEMAEARGYPKLASWLEKTGMLWNENGRGRRSFLEQYDYFGQLSAQFPIGPIRVVYTKAGTNLAAAVVRDGKAIIDQSLYWAAVESLEEARYLCGILNSEALRAGVERYQSEGQWGARHFDKYVFNLPIPRFDEGDALHRALADAAETAERVADAVAKTEGEYFTKIRGRVRAALAGHGVASRLEILVAELFNAALRTRRANRPAPARSARVRMYST